MRIFSVPADFRTSTIDRYFDLNKRYDDAKVTETYGQATVGVLTNSGRSSNLLPTLGLKELEAYVSYSADRGIDFNYTLNASCMGNMEFTDGGIKKISRHLSDLWGAGVRHLTISLPQLITLVRDLGYKFNIKTSTICLVNSAHKAAFYKNQGIDRLVVDEDITRDFRRIRQICRTFGDGVEVIVNSICMKDCPYKMFHYNHEAHFSSAVQDIKRFYDHSCIVQKANDWTSPLRLNWIRPEDLGYYENLGIHSFKLQGRHAAMHGDPVRAVEAYMSGSYSGNLYDLLNLFEHRREGTRYYPYIDNEKLEGFISAFYNNPNHCSGDCDACNYCETFAEASIDREKTEKMLQDVLAYYGEREPFKVHQEQPGYIRFARRVARRAVKSAVKRG